MNESSVIRIPSSAISTVCAMSTMRAVTSQIQSNHISASCCRCRSEFSRHCVINAGANRNFRRPPWPSIQSNRPQQANSFVKCPGTVSTRRRGPKVSCSTASSPPSPSIKSRLVDFVYSGNFLPTGEILTPLGFDLPNRITQML